MRRGYIIAVLCLLISAMAFAQVPQTISYQAVVRSGSGELVREKPITMRVNILHGDALGESVYEELHRPSTNKNGLVDIEIGAGLSDASFSAIDWSDTPYYIMVEIDPLGGDNYSIYAVNQILAVPYAIYATKAGMVYNDSLYHGYAMFDNMTIDNVLETGNDANSQRIQGVGEPEDSQDAVSKKIVDSIADILQNAYGHSFIDHRDNNIYTYVTIGSQTWMAENLRYEGHVPLAVNEDDYSETEPFRYYPNGDKSNVVKYGYLYNWTAAMDGANSSDANPSHVQGICPVGWHLPSSEEWFVLIQSTESSEYAAILAGRPELWVEGELVNNQYFGVSGFNAVPAGSCSIYDNGYLEFMEVAHIWTSFTDWYPGYASNMTIYSGGWSNNCNSTGSDYGCSVRCVKDE